MKHKRNLLQLYDKKIQEIDEDIALVELMEIICHDIENKKYKEGNDVFKTTKTDNIAEIKKEYFYKIKYIIIIHNGEFQTSLKKK